MKKSQRILLTKKHQTNISWGRKGLVFGVIFFALVFSLVIGYQSQVSASNSKDKYIAPFQSIINSKIKPVVSAIKKIQTILPKNFYNYIPKPPPNIVTPSVTPSNTPTNTPVPEEASADNQYFIAQEEEIIKETPKSQVAPITDLAITKVDNTLKLSWTKPTGAVLFKIYRSKNPYFIPQRKDLIAFTRKSEYADRTKGIVGDPDNNYFYVVTSVGKGGESDVSNRVGEFDYTFKPNIDKYIAVPFTSLPYNNAREFTLYANIQRGNVARWNFPSQKWDVWFVETNSGTNFSISAGMPLKITNGTKKVITSTFVGPLFSNEKLPIDIDKGMNLIGQFYLKEINLYEAGFKEYGAFGANSEPLADRAWAWNENMPDYDYAWLVDGVGPNYDGKWWDGKAWKETKITLKPGYAYWYQRRGMGSFVWQNPTPTLPDDIKDLKSPSPITDLNIVKNDNSLSLSWSKSEQARFYRIYRANDPYFTPSKATLIGTTSKLQFTDSTKGIVGDPDNNYFYVATAINRKGESDISNRVGKFDYRLYQHNWYEYKNILPLALDTSSYLSDAQSLADYIGSKVVEVNYFDNIKQEFISWNPRTQTGTNFDLKTAEVYWVRLEKGSGTTTVTITGQVPPNDVFTYTFKETDQTDFTYIVLPLDKSGLKKTSELAEDIEKNSSVDIDILAVSEWNSVSQSYRNYTTIPIRLGDFDIKIGQPYRIGVDIIDDNSAIWPDKNTENSDLSIKKPEAIKDLTIEKQENSLKLSWSQVDQAKKYYIYRSTEPYFTPSKDNLIKKTKKTEFTDKTKGIVGDPDKNYFYVVTAVNKHGESDISNRVGEFDYRFEAKTTNYITLPFTNISFATADEFATYMGLKKGSIWHWDLSKSLWNYRIPDINFGTNFPVKYGESYMVSTAASDTEDKTIILTLVGQLPVESTPLSLRIGNAVPISLLYQDITRASDLGNMLLPYSTKISAPSINNSPEEGKKIEFIDGGWQGEDFPVKGGYVYFVYLSRPLQWIYPNTIIPGPRWDSPIIPFGEDKIYELYQGQEFVLQTQVSDPDTLLENLNYEIAHQPPGGFFDKTTLQYRITPTANSGYDAVDLWVSDGASKDRLYFRFHFNPAPIISIAPPVTLVPTGYIPAPSPAITIIPITTTPQITLVPTGYITAPSPNISIIPITSAPSPSPITTVIPPTATPSPTLSAGTPTP